MVMRLHENKDIECGVFGSPAWVIALADTLLASIHEIGHLQDRDRKKISEALSAILSSLAEYRATGKKPRLIAEWNQGGVGNPVLGQLVQCLERYIEYKKAEAWRDDDRGF